MHRNWNSKVNMSEPCAPLGVFGKVALTSQKGLQNVLSASSVHPVFRVQMQFSPHPSHMSVSCLLGVLKDSGQLAGLMFSTSFIFHYCSKIDVMKSFDRTWGSGSSPRSWKSSFRPEHCPAIVTGTFKMFLYSIDSPYGNQSMGLCWLSNVR